MNTTEGMTFELHPRYDSRKSFYGKARIEHQPDGTTILWSYNTVVAQVNHDLEQAHVYGTYSPTTLRHIKEFLKQYGFKADSKKQIEEDYA